MRKPSVVGYGYFLEFPNTAILIYMGMSPIGHIPAKPLNPPPTTNYQGYRMVPLNLKVLTKFGLCSNCSKKLDACSLARARKIFASACMLRFSLKFPATLHKHNLHLEQTKTVTGNNVSRMRNWETLGKHAHTMDVSGKMLPHFVGVY